MTCADFDCFDAALPFVYFQDSYQGTAQRLLTCFLITYVEIITADKHNETACEFA